MKTQTMTVEQALAAGYEKCIEDENSNAMDIDDLDWEDIGGTIWILEKEGKHIQLDDDWLRERLDDFLYDQESDVSLDDLRHRVMDYLDADLNYSAITGQINKAMSGFTYWENTGIELERPEEYKE